MTSWSGCEFYRRFVGKVLSCKVVILRCVPSAINDPKYKQINKKAQRHCILSGIIRTDCKQEPTDKTAAKSTCLLVQHQVLNRSCSKSFGLRLLLKKRETFYGAIIKRKRISTWELVKSVLITTIKQKRKKFKKTAVLLMAKFIRCGFSIKFSFQKKFYFWIIKSKTKWSVCLFLFRILNGSYQLWWIVVVCR